MTQSHSDTASLIGAIPCRSEPTRLPFRLSTCVWVSICDMVISTMSPTNEPGSR